MNNQIKMNILYERECYVLFSSRMINIVIVFLLLCYNKRKQD